MEASMDILVLRGSSMEVPWKQLKSVELRGPPRNLHGTFMEPTSAEVSVEAFSE